jgi:hypothetical protein
LPARRALTGIGTHDQRGLPNCGGARRGRRRSVRRRDPSPRLCPPPSASSARPSTIPRWSSRHCRRLNRRWMPILRRPRRDAPLPASAVLMPTPNLAALAALSDDQRARIIEMLWPLNGRPMRPSTRCRAKRARRPRHDSGRGPPARGGRGPRNRRGGSSVAAEQLKGPSPGIGGESPLDELRMGVV